MAEMKILIADDDPYVLAGYDSLFEGENFQLITTQSGSRAVELITQDPHTFDLAIIDYELRSDLRGDEVIKKIKTVSPNLPVVLVSGLIGRGDLNDKEAKEVADNCAASGADRLLPKGQGVSNLSDFVFEISRNKRKPLVSESVRNKKIKDILKMEGVSQGLYEVALAVEKYSPLDHTVLIRGETGVGKEGVAKALHQNSKRAHANFVAINCASVPKDLIESEFFGHKKGSFTGAMVDKPGKILQAHYGSLFLDEIGDMPFELQAKLLRFLQERMIEPVGSLQPTKVDIRIISATHKDLENAIETKHFREDLFYRLRELVITVPPLRERSDDIEPIALAKVAQFNSKYNTQKSLSDKALKKLKAYIWPGNIRELNAMLMAAHAAADRVIQAKDLDKALTENVDQRLEATRKISSVVMHDELSRKQNLEEKENLINALAAAKNNKEFAARLLGFKHSSQLKYRMKATGLNPHFKWGGETGQSRPKTKRSEELYG